MQKIILGLLLLCFNLPLLAADDEAPAEKNPGYISLGEPMVLNLATDSRKLIFLQLKADVLIKDDEAKELVELHIPAIRHQVIIMLSEQRADDMKSPVKREAVRLQVTEKVRAKFKEMTGNEDIEEVLFSNFLVQ